MGTGIMICGMNGSGKSTLGKALAERLNFRFIDNENLYFQRSDPNEPYGTGRTKEEVIRLIDEQGQLTDELLLNINNAKTLRVLIIDDEADQASVNTADITTDEKKVKSGTNTASPSLIPHAIKES